MISNHDESQRGFSIVELLVVVGVMGFIALAVSQMLVNQFRETRSLKEVLALRELETQIRQAFVRPDYLSCLLRGRTLDTTVTPVVWNTPVAQFPVAYQMPAPAMPTACTAVGGNIVESGAALPGETSIQIASVTMGDTISMGSGNYSATFLIQPDAASLVRGLRAIRVPIDFRVDVAAGSANARPFLSASGSSPTAAGALSVIELKCQYAPGSPCPPPGCPAGWTDVGISSVITAYAGAPGVYAGYNSRHCMAP